MSAPKRAVKRIWPLTVVRDSSTGKRLWEFQTGAGVNAPAGVFEYEGDQYVVAYSAGSQFGGSPRGDSVWLFSLKGTLEPAAPASIAPPPATAAPAAARPR